MIEFAHFWRAYPKKRGVGAARNAWRKLTTQERAAATRGLSKLLACQDEIPLAATWLRQRRWRT